MNVLGQLAINSISVGHSKKGIAYSDDNIRHAYMPSYELFVKMYGDVVASYINLYRCKPDKKQIQFLVVSGLFRQVLNVQEVKDGIQEYAKKNKRKINLLKRYTMSASGTYITMIFVVYEKDAPKMQNATLNKLGNNIRIHYGAVFNDLEDASSMVRGFNRDLSGTDKQFERTVSEFGNFKKQAEQELYNLYPAAVTKIKSENIGFAFLALLALSDLNANQQPLKGIYYTSSRLCAVNPEILNQDYPNV